MYYKDSIRVRDIATLSKYSNDKFKVVYFKKSLLQKGFERTQEYRKSGVNQEKLENNISRAKSRIYDYAYCNNWDYFITLTINPKRYSRTDLNSYYKDFTQWLRDYSKRYKTKIKYIFIPELHKDGKSWHMHGLISGIPENRISDFNKRKHNLDLIKNGYKNWQDYGDRFGFVSLGVIRNKEATAKYCTKYINKALQNSVKDLGAHMYYNSKYLKLPEEIKRGSISDNMQPDFENEFVKIKWIDNLSDAVKLFKMDALNANYTMIQKSIKAYDDRDLRTSIMAHIEDIRNTTRTIVHEL